MVISSLSLHVLVNSLCSFFPWCLIYGAFHAEIMPSSIEFHVWGLSLTYSIIQCMGRTWKPWLSSHWKPNQCILGKIQWPMKLASWKAYCYNWCETNVVVFNVSGTVINKCLNFPIYFVVCTLLLSSPFFIILNAENRTIFEHLLGMLCANIIKTCK